jgi:hypothetical protein
MGNKVFANGREISCKAARGKSICAFPDVCFTPPENPATPPGVPVPYPNTGLAKDTSGGSKTVKISGKEVMLQNKSYFKKSTGDEAGSAAKKSVVTSTNRGKVYFNSWSMDVKFEGKNVVRHLDLTTHNHMSLPGNTPPWPYADEMFLAAIEAWSQAAPRCECCGGLAHSEAQARGDEVSEAQFYSGHPDGPTFLELAREHCPEIVPPPPPTDDPCAKYYEGIKSTKAPRAEFSQAGANPLSNPNSLPHVYGRGRMAHKVPLAAGGCPIGEGNLAPVGDDPDCQYLENISGEIQRSCMNALN